MLKPEDINQMGDDEFNKFNLSSLNEEEKEPEEEAEQSTEEDSAEESNVEDEQETDLDDEEQAEISVETSSDESDETEHTEESDEEEKSENSKTDTPSDDLYKQTYEELFKPFKAAGKQVSIESVEEARILMQKGVDYHRKMENLKPKRQMLKVLEKNGITSHEDLAFLIDLKNHQPEAVAKLLQESKLDSFDLNEEVASKYKTATQPLSDSEYELENVLEDLKSSPKYGALMSMVGTTWDDKSREVLTKQPELLRALDEQMISGVFESIWAEVEKRRALGKLDGVSDVQAYYEVGQELMTRQEQVQVQQQAKEHQKVNEANKQRAKISAGTRNKGSVSKSTNKLPSVEDILSASEEEFSKMEKYFEV